ncbi:MAG: restriction endonuclease [Verrucomicrobia bacterium]|nr:restriction endonuclease [Verrucomicrobiota bacterium]
MKELKVGNSGGVRVSKNCHDMVDRIVLFSSSEQESNPQENPYRDTTEGAVLTYTGTGRIGNQNLTGPNLRIVQQNKEFFPVYVFSLYKHRKSVGSPDKRWRFSGIYKYLNHGRQDQTDLLGLSRDAWVFKFFMLDIVEAHPNIESKIRNEIARAYSDPLLSPRVILGDLPLFSASEVEGSIKKMEVLDPIAFERFIKRALIASEFRDVQVTKKSSDGGIDLIARMPFTVWPVEKQIIQIQAKRWKKSVGRREIAQMRGSLMPTAIGVIITTGNYARTAILESVKPNQLPISLVDGYRMAIVSMRLNLEINE